MTYCGYFCDVLRERHRNKRQSTYRRPKWGEFFKLQIENYTCSTRLWLSYFICDNKHTFVKQMSPDLAMLLAFFTRNRRLTRQVTVSDVLKATGKQKGRTSPSIIFVEGNSSRLKINFVWFFLLIFFFLLKISDVNRFINFWQMCEN